MKFKVPKLKGDTGKGEITRLEDAVKKVKGVTNVSTSPKDGSIDITYGTEVQVSALRDAAKKAGFELRDGA